MIYVTVENNEQFNTVLNIKKVSGIALDVAAFSDKDLFMSIDKIKDKNKKSFLKLERISRYEDKILNLINNTIKYISYKNLDGLIIENIDEFAFIIKNFDIIIKNHKIFELHVDYTMNITNLLSKNFYKNIFYNKLNSLDIINDNYKLLFCPSVEISRREIQKLDIQILPVYGYIPLMVSSNCLFKTTDFCKEKSSGVIKDRYKNTMCVKAYCKYCYNKIFNKDCLYLCDLADDFKIIKRYDFTFEDGEMTENVLIKDKRPENFTRGHYNKSFF